jgi:outer membrane protein OmpA-like peptidoglycan-associated protein
MKGTSFPSGETPVPAIAWLMVLATLLAGCGGLPESRPAAGASPGQPETAASSQPPAAAAAPAPLLPPAAMPFDEAVLSAAHALLSKAQLPAAGQGAQPRYTLVIDPLIDGMTGAQSRATQSMGARLTGLIREKYPQYEVQPFSAANVAKSPLVLVGTFTGVNQERKTAGSREAYRICLALADLKSGKLVSKGLAFAQMTGVDATPTAYFRDSPTWTEDPSTLGYIRTCQGTKAGDPINPLYVDRILAASIISEAIDAYGAGQYADALYLYESALRVPEGNQFRVFTGLYLANWKLGRREAAAQAFGQVVDFGLEHKRLGVKFLFKQGSTAFWPDKKITEPYPLWLGEIAARAGRKQSCLEITGHTSPSGPEPMNERLSLLRAEYIKNQMQKLAPALVRRTIANGVGSRESMVGTGKDDASDALDRRVEFKVISC